MHITESYSTKTNRKQATKPIQLHRPHIPLRQANPANYKSRHRDLRTSSRSKISTYIKVTNICTLTWISLRTSSFSTISSFLTKEASGLPGTFSCSFSHWEFFPHLLTVCLLLNLPEENLYVLSNLQLCSTLIDQAWRRQLFEQLGRKGKMTGSTKKYHQQTTEPKLKTH